MPRDLRIAMGFVSCLAQLPILAWHLLALLTRGGILLLEWAGKPAVQELVVVLYWAVGLTGESSGAAQHTIAKGQRVGCAPFLPQSFARGYVLEG